MSKINWDEFKEDATDAIGRVAAEAGINPSYLLGLAKLETRLGDKTIRGGGADTRNLFNIKDFAGGGIRARDKAEGSNDAYRQYDSYEESARDLVSLLGRKFPAALKAKSPIEFASALKSGGYATDPDYTDKLASVIDGKGKSAVNWDDFKPADPEVNWDEFTPVNEARPLPAGVKPSNAGAGRGSVNPPLAEPDKPMVFSDPMGTGASEIMAAAKPARTSVLEGLPMPELPFDSREAERLSNRAYAERTRVPGTPHKNLPSLRPSSGPERISTATGLGESLQDMPLPVKAVAKAGSGILQGLGGVARAAGDLTGMDALARGGALTAKQGSEFDQALGTTGPVEGFGPKSPVPYLADMAEGAGSSLAQTALFAATFGPGAVIPLMSVQTAGQEYDKARTSGLDPSMALAGAIPKGIFEAVGEKFTGLDKAAAAMGTLLQKGASDAAKRTAGEALLRAGIREIPGEVVTYLGQTGTDLLPGIGLNQNLTMREFVDGLRDTVVQSAMMGGAMGGGGALAKSQHLPPQPIPSAKDLIAERWGGAFAQSAGNKAPQLADLVNASNIDDAITAADAATQSGPADALAAPGNIGTLLQESGIQPRAAEAAMPETVAESLPAAINPAEPAPAQPVNTAVTIEEMARRIAELEGTTANVQAAAPRTEAQTEAVAAQAPEAARTAEPAPEAGLPAGRRAAVETNGLTQPVASFRQNGTLDIKGDPTAILASLKANGLTGLRTREGVQVGRSQAAQAESIFLKESPAPQPMQPPSKPVAPELPAAAVQIEQSGPLGRDNQPMNEGGKPYKTNAAAKEAKKLQPMMRVVSVEGGFALADKTPKQLAAEQKAARRLRNPQTSAPGEPIPAHAFIAAEGGLHVDTKPDMNVGGNPRIGNRMLFGGAGKGLSMERATARLIEEGYLDEGASHSQAMALIKRSLTQPQYNADGYERIAEAESQARFDDYLAAEQEEPSPEILDEDAAFLALRGYTEPTAEEWAEINALVHSAEADGIDTEIALLHAGQAEEQTNNQDYANDHAEIEASEYQPAGGQRRAEAEVGRAEPGRQAAESAGDRNGQPADRQEGAGEVAPGEIAPTAELTHNGTLIYPVKMAGQDGTAPTERWAVESKDNKQRRESGDRNRGGDSLHVTVEDAKQAADFEAKRDDEESSRKAELATQEKAGQEALQAKRDANKGKSLTEIKAQIFMAQEIRDGGQAMTRSAWVDRLVGAGESPSVQMVDKIKPLSRAAYNRASNQEQHTHEQKIKSSGQVAEYSIGDYIVSKTEYDYAKKLSDSAITQDHATQATAILDAAKVTGKERIDVLKDIKRGDVTPEELQAAYPAKVEGLTAPSKQDILDQQQRAEAAAKSEKAQQRAADELARRERERKDIAKASEAAADTFTLGGDAEQNLSGQAGMFDAPEPKPERKIQQTDTPAFREWFGDSKAVDANGKPLVMYHGTGADISVFGKDGLGAHFTSDKTLASDFANSHPSGSVLPVYLSIANPLRIEDHGGLHSDATSTAEALIKAGALPKSFLSEDFYSRLMSGDRKNKNWYAESNAKELTSIRKILQSKGYDGIVYENTGERGGDAFIPFEPAQIKSAIGNNGQFDASNDDIRFSRAKGKAAEKLDMEYMAAVEADDMKTAQRLVNEAAAAAGYSDGTNYRMNHQAPNSDGDTGLVDLRTSGIVPADYWTHPHWYATTPEERESHGKVMSLFRVMDKRKQDGKNPGLVGMYMYRAVPKDVKDSTFRNGDWITPSLAYAQNEGRMIPDGYRIIATRVAAKNLWWDANSIAEMGYDDGNGYAYKNTKNNRKLLDAVTRDDDGAIIPLSQRFNMRSDQARFSFAGQNTATPLTDAASVRNAVAEKFPELASSIDRMLARGQLAQKGGLVVIESADARDIAEVYASKTDRTLANALRLIQGDAQLSEAGDIQGFYDPKSGLQFIVTPNVSGKTAPAVVLHEAVHGQQRADLDAKAQKMLNGRGSKVQLQKTRDFLARVVQRIDDSGETGNVKEAFPYVVEQAVLEGRQAGFSKADGKFLDWVDSTLGKGVGNFLRDLVATIRASALKRGFDLTPSIDDLVTLAKMAVHTAADGTVVTSKPRSVASSRPAAPGNANTVLPRSESPAKTPLYEVFRQLGRFDDSFQTVTSRAQDLGAIAKEMQAKPNPANQFTADTGTAMHQGKRKPVLALRIKDAAGNSQKLLDIFEPDSVRPFIVIGNSELGQDVNGARAYQIAFAWAHNNGKTMRPDPAGLTVINRLRRTEAMVSSALHYGTTEHLEPHQDQYIALTDKARINKVEPEDTHYGSRPDTYNQLEGLKQKLWTGGNEPGTMATNVQHLIEASGQLAALREPAIKDFEVVDGQLRRRGVSGEVPLADVADGDASGQVNILGVMLRPASSGVGGNTLKRYAVAASAGREIQRRQSQVRGRDGQDRGNRNLDDVEAVRAIRQVLGDLSGGTPEVLKGTLYSRAEEAAAAPMAAQQPGLFTPNIWSTPDPTRMDRIIYELQDGKVDLKRIQESIKASGQAIEEQFDARLAETLYPGRVAHRSQQFLASEVKTLLQAMAINKVTMNEMADYLHARGAEERNQQIAKVNPAMPDGGAGTNTQGTLLTNQAARDYLDNITPERLVALKATATKVDAITAGTRALLVGEGLEKQSTIDAWDAAYKNYVPMFRDEAEDGFPSHPQGSGFAVKGGASKRATGSTKEVTNILAHVLMQREAAITRAEKNRVAMSLYGMALSHPNPEFWTTIKPSMSGPQIGAELVAMGVDPMMAEIGMEGIPTIRTVDANTGKVVNRPNPMYRNLPGAIPLKINGEDRVLMLNVKGERGQRLAESLKNLDGLTAIDWSVGLLGKVFPFIPKSFGIGSSTRWLAAVNTQYNPAFGLVNLTRDVMEGALNIGSTDLRGNGMRVLGHVPAAIQGIGRELSGNSNTWGDLYKQFVADGGQTGYKENWRDANDRAKAIEKELAHLTSIGKLSPGRAAHAALDLLDGFNTTLENAVRLSAYKVALDKGMSRAEAARLGRELTVDFNRKGRMGRELGPLYAFFNASVQGTERALRTLTGPTGGKIIVGGLTLGVIQALMLAAAGYDDDEIPEFVKTRAFIIPIPGKEKRYVSIPMPLGFLSIPNTGRVLTELTLNGGKNISKRIVGAIGEIAGSFNPLGGGNVFTADGALKTVAPTVIDPLIEIGFNKNFAGGQIEKKPFREEGDNRPGWARVKEATQRSATGQAYLGISKAINTLTGGTDYEAGHLSPTPERLRYLAQTAGGGVLREIEKTINASAAASRGDNVKASQIPVVGRFYGEVDDDQLQISRYYDASDKISKAYSSFKAADNAGDLTALKRIAKENPELAGNKALNQVRSSISNINKLAVETVNNPEQMRKIDALRVSEMKQLNILLKNLENAEPTLADRLRSGEAVTP